MLRELPSSRCKKIILKQSSPIASGSKIRCGFTSKAVAVATAQALINRHLEINLNHLNFGDSSWSKNPFKRMGYRRGLATQERYQYQKLWRMKMEKSYLYPIVKKIENNEIPDLWLSI